METVKIKSSHPESQGEFVILNKEDFDVTKHELYEASTEQPGADDSQHEQKMSVAQMRHALTERGIEIPDGAKKGDLQALLSNAD